MGLFDNKVKKLVKKREYGELITMHLDGKDVITEIRNILYNADDNFICVGAIRALGRIGEKDPSSIEPVISTLTVHTESDEWDLVRTSAIRALGKIGMKDPNLLKPAIGRLMQLLDDEKVFSAASETIGDICKNYREEIKIAIPTIISSLNNEKPSFHGGAAYAIWKIAMELPEEVLPAIPKLANLLDHTNSNVRVNATAALGIIAEKYPEEISPTIPRLIQLLYDDNSNVKAYSAKALGNIGKEELQEPLQRLCSDTQSVYIDEKSTSIDQVVAEAINKIKKSVLKNRKLEIIDMIDEAFEREEESNHD